MSGTPRYWRIRIKLLLDLRNHAIGTLQMLLDGTHADTQLGRNLLLRTIIDPVASEHIDGALRQCVEGGPDAGKLLPSQNRVLGRRTFVAAGLRPRLD